MTIRPKYETTPRRPRQARHVPPAVLAALTARDGHVSAWTGRDVPELVPQHRQGGAGGRRGKHRLSNLVWLESSINGLIESDSQWQAEATLRGIKISLHADPEAVEIRHEVHGAVLLKDTGEVIHAQGRQIIRPVPD